MQTLKRQSDCKSGATADSAVDSNGSSLAFNRMFHD